MIELPADAFKDSMTQCISAAATELRLGTLSIALGAGVSRGMGLPTWLELVNECCGATGHPLIPLGDSRNNRALLSAMTHVEKKSSDTRAFREMIRNALYKNSRSDRALIGHVLLSAIGTLTMRSRRGFVSEVVTLNFDDLLEKYLWLHGFQVQSIHNLPQLRLHADLTVYHIHGFLPSDSKFGRDSDNLVFSGWSFDQFVGKEKEPFKELLRDILCRKVMLFVGMSPDQPSLKTVVAGLFDQLSKEQGRIVGFWLLGPDDDPEWDLELVASNIVPVRLQSYEEYPDFLLRVCQAAAMSS